MGECIVTNMTRRSFVGALPAAVPVLGANDRVRVALIGAGGRGRDLLHNASAVAGVEVAVICDPDENRMRQMAAEAEKRTGRKPSTQPDLRKVIEDKEIDAIILTCCNHWHALATVWAVQAGKHVFVEKPVSHDIVEGQKMVEAARKYKRVVQAGTQRRSSPRFQRAVAQLREGLIGDIYLGRYLFTGPRESLGFKQPGPPPPELHWDLWLGPAPTQPFHANLVHYNWHWFWDFGNGEMGNNGVHNFDILRWGMNRGIPTRVQSVGGRYGYKDQGQTPNTQSATLAYPDGAQILCEIRGLYSNEPIGMHFYGSKGSMHLDPQGNCQVFLGRSRQAEALPPVPAGNMEVGHFQNFVDAIRANRPELLTCGIEECEQSTALCHIANVSYRLGRELRFDPVSRRFLGDSEANHLLARPGRNGFRMPDKV
jgi:predicted dehydrogenase